jgi:aminoglycoside phosphotransferase (APT) family kinase protein
LRTGLNPEPAKLSVQVILQTHSSAATRWPGRPYQVATRTPNPYRRLVPSLSDAPSAELVRWAAGEIGPSARVLSWEPLTGGITAAVHLLVVEHNDDVLELVLKCWTRGDPEERRGCVEREARVLQLLETADVAAPRYIASTSGAETDEVPALLMTRLPGQVWLRPTDPREWLRQMATALAQLHEVRPPDGLPSLEVLQRPVLTPRDSRRPDLWQDVGGLLARPAPAGAGFVHGDYQHFNLLWQHERLTGIVDWTWTGVGHPDRDVGHCRLNLAILFTPQWAEDFTATYESEAGRATDPWWDAFEITRYGEDWQRFIPVQVAGRAPVDPAGMTDRVEALLRRQVS